MIEGDSARLVLADNAYASKANRERLRGKHRDGILRKAARHRPLRASEKRVNKRISKRLFGLPRDRDFGQAKPHVQLAMVAIGQNLLKAANKITFTPPPPCNRLNRNDKITMSAETTAGRARGANQISSSKSRPRAEVFVL